ncbi:MAG: hypothetical protein AMJ79_15335 [Phycisphaerae bacterium SM23_30]|nr:MAG: hypothetical protein AMJ79_15335 [Phycisphaerae bacterium SM23_30]
MSSGLKIPPAEEDAIATMETMVEAARPTRNYAKVKWLYFLRYAQGDRKFLEPDFLGGSISTILNAPAENEFKFEGFLPYYQTELGRLLQLDLRPVVKRKGEGLDGLQKASIGQIILNDRMPRQQAEIFKNNLLPLFLQLGHVGIGAFADKDDPQGPHLELIPPWELMYYPVIPVSRNSIEMPLRVRYVTKDWLDERGLLAKGQDNKFEWQEIPVGNVPEDTTHAMTKDHQAYPPFGVGGRGKYKSKSPPRTQKWTEFVEGWGRTPQNRLKIYLAKAGKNLLVRSDSEDKDIPMPVNTCGYLGVGSAYDRGFLEQFIELNAEAEAMLESLIQNVVDYDIYGMLALSTSMGLSKKEVQEAREGTRILMYNWDMYNPGEKPFNIPPAHAGMMAPLKTLQTALELMNIQAQQSEILKGDAPGRVDNAKALTLLFETANVPLGGPTESIAAAMSASYEALLWLTRDRWPARQAVELTLNDDALVGIRYNQKTGDVELEKDSIPLPSEIEIAIASKMPRSTAQVRADLDELLQNGIITPRTYRIKAREEGLKLPLGDDVEWQNYRRAKMENVALYGDGMTPGRVIYSAEFDMHEIHLEVLHAFMSRAEYHLASAAVKAAFEEHYHRHYMDLGNYPEQISQPEDEAEQRLLMEKYARTG